MSFNEIKEFCSMLIHTYFTINLIFFILFHQYFREYVRILF